MPRLLSAHNCYLGLQLSLLRAVDRPTTRQSTWNHRSRCKCHGRVFCCDCKNLHICDRLTRYRHLAHALLRSKSHLWKFGHPPTWRFHYLTSHRQAISHHSEIHLSSNIHRYPISFHPQNLQSSSCRLTKPQYRHPMTMAHCGGTHRVLSIYLGAKVPHNTLSRVF